MGKTILTPNQRRILEYAAADPVIVQKFYVTGGTALSEFYLKHRISEDLDFFTEQIIDEVSLNKWVQNTAKRLPAEVTFQTLREQIVYYFHFPKEIVKVDFAYFPFSPLGIFTYFNKLRIASIEDVATNKLQAIMTRSRGRDYVDLFAIMQVRKLKAEDLVKNYRLKYDVFIPVEQLVKRFTAVVDASDQPRFLGTTRWEEIESFFIKQAKELESKILS